MLWGMKVVFADQKLALIHTDRAHELGLPFAVIKRAREKLNFLAQAPDERTLRSWKSLNYKRLEGNGDRRQIRINDQFRIIFEMDEAATPCVITVLEIGDPH
ncbi:type II toxin-antitoxin system RelE/ParE family toxin [Geminicoccus harenae]|uniref:type II toxin-antitoxin system RelE/ParE family toxin n=1 Tax=Geminicoccus harenae TaxID=2498453 RepID=UPI0034DADF17